KRTWSGADLGIPGNIGGLVFSPSGNELYVVGDADEPESAIYKVPLTRVAHEVVDLRASARVLGATTGGFDAGLEFGPAGTLFYGYFQTTLLGQRAGGVAGAEATRDLTNLGVSAF